MVLEGAIRLVQLAIKGPSSTNDYMTDQKGSARTQASTGANEDTCHNNLQGCARGSCLESRQSEAAK
jgi:hypothetical protein